MGRVQAEAREPLLVAIVVRGQTCMAAALTGPLLNWQGDLAAIRFRLMLHVDNVMVECLRPKTAFCIQD
jgi:hypothetical protein